METSIKNKADFLKASLKFLFVLPGNPAKKEDLSKYGGKYKYILFILKRCRSLEILVHVCVSIKIFVHNVGGAENRPIRKIVPKGKKENAPIFQNSKK